MRIPIISPEIYVELLRVQPSSVDKMELRPCEVELTDGRVLDRVYVVEAVRFTLYWGMLPNPGRGVSIRDVAHVRESPTRLPIKLANTLYEKGETNMGGTVFSIVTRDGRKVHGVTGNAVDFLIYPPGIGPSDVVDVLHGKSEGNEQFASAHFQWCLYGLPPDESAKQLGNLETALRNWKVDWRAEA